MDWAVSSPRPPDGALTAMRWLAFAALAIVCVTLHTTVAPRLAVAGARPDWILVAVVFFAMHVRSLDAVVAGWTLGLLADFQTAERFGLLSLVYGLTALLVYFGREHMFRSNPFAHFAMTLVAGLIVQFMLWTYYAVGVGAGGASWFGQLFTVGWAALYTALWAPPVHACLLKLSPWLGLAVPRYSHAGLARTGG